MSSLLSKLTTEAEMTTRLQTEQIEEGLSRRGLVQALAAGAAPIARDAERPVSSARRPGGKLPRCEGP
jgi:hypothetical protein